MNIIKVEDGLQDFNCPWCDTPLEDDSEYHGNYEFDEVCPECKTKIRIYMREVSHLEYSIKKL